MTRMKRMTTSLCIPLGALLCLSGCSTMAPKYTQPAAPVTATWPSGPAYQTKTAAAAEKAAADVPWREFFVDDKLRKLIELTLKNNRDVRIALLNIERSRAQYQIQRSDLFPKVNATGGASFQRIPQGFSASGAPVTVDQYSVGVGLLSYELDLFGRVRSLKDQALEQFLATEQARRSVQISLISQVASGYLSLAADQERLKLARETLTSQQDSYQLFQRRFAAGISSDLDLQQARASVEAARVDIARYTTLIAQDKNALIQLVGSSLPADLFPSTLSENLTVVKDVPAGLPSEVLLRRPDIVQAEGVLKSANANIGAARAAFFPKITLVSSVGFGSNELSTLFKSNSLAWGFAPNISLPIFDGGSNTANLKVAEINRDIMVAQYEKAIQSAFREVADALAQRGTIDEQLSAQQALTDATSTRYRLSQARFDKGVDSHLSVLDSQRSLYAAEQNLISVRLSRLTNLVTLYKVLGGGDKE